MKILKLFPLLLLGLLAGCKTVSEATLQVTNPGKLAQKNAFFQLDLGQLPAAVSQIAPDEMALTVEGSPIPFQVNDRNGDGAPEDISFVLNLKSGETKSVTIKKGAAGSSASFPKRTQAELSHKVGGTWENRKYIGGDFQNVQQLTLPPEHTDHSFFIRYEGPGWESDKVGYRFYLDWRNATDVFGKTTSDMVLQDVGQDGFDSYHEIADWGMDILKVGGSLGIGTPARWLNNKAERVAVTDSVASEVVLNGPVESLIRTQYYGWETGEKKVTLTSELSIVAGSRLTKNHLQLSAPLDSLCTGIIQLPNTQVLQRSEGNWGYLATWGQQSLNQDNLGLAIIYRTADLLASTTDSLNHVVVLQPQNQELTYYFLAAWEKEPNGITTQEAFSQYLDNLLASFLQPATMQSR